MAVAAAGRRGAGVRAVALFFGLVGLTAAAAGWAWFEVDAATREREARLSLLDSLKRGSPQRLAEAAAGTVDRREPHLDGDSETLAAAGMERRARGIVETAGGEVFSTQLLMKTEGDDPLRRIELQIVFDGTIEVVQAALYELETGMPVGLVDELSLQPGRRDQVDDGEAGRSLRAAVTVSSFWRRRT